MKEKAKKTKGEKFRSLFTSNWISKLASLIIAMGVWFTIFTHLEKTKPLSAPPVPGTIPIPQTREQPPKPPIPLLNPGAAIPGSN
ncbi:MAG: hypothetical protein P1V20_10030 [Verrucomicrobiales bacterium]|nr:hypothetical protein [Verrucomicrobiales bacterium]